MDTPRLHALEARHAEIDRLIHEEAVRPQPNADTLSMLKKQKLRLKEEIVFH